VTTRSVTQARVLVVSLALMCLLAGWLVGHNWPAAPERAHGYLAQLKDTLDLRPDQVAAVERVLNEEDRDLDALLSRGLQGIRGDVAARRERTEKDVLAVLDDAQRRRYAELTTAEAAR